MTPSEEETFCEVANIHLKNGTTTIVPTAVSAPMESVFEMIEVCKKAFDKCPSIYGLHLEVGKGVICRIMAACELDNMQEFAQTLRENGIGLALGHSDATAAQALKGFQWGFSHITHLYSATPSVRKINQVVTAGVIEAAYLDDNVTESYLGAKLPENREIVEDGVAKLPDRSCFAGSIAPWHAC